MRSLIFIWLYLLIAVSMMQNLLPLAVLLIVLFTIRFSAFWLFILAAMLDGYFGGFSSIPMFSIVMLMWFGLSEFIRPLLRPQ